MDGLDLPPSNFATEDALGRIWITVSTRLPPRALGYRRSCSNGLVIILITRAPADESHHENLVLMAGNRLLRESVMSYWNRAHRAHMFTLRLRPKPVNSTQEHMALVERLRQGDAAGAAAVNRGHRERASRELLVFFEKFRLQQM